MNLEELLCAKKFAEQAVSEGLADVNTMRFEEVPHIPAASEAEANVIYLYKNGMTGFYDMYVLINGAVKRLDDTTVDLSSYAKKDDVPTKISQLDNDKRFINNAAGSILLTNYLTNEEYLGLLEGKNIPGEKAEEIFLAIDRITEQGKFPLIYAPSEVGYGLNNLQLMVMDANKGYINQIQLTLFTPLFRLNQVHEAICYNYTVHRGGTVQLTKFQPDEIEKVYYESYYDFTADEYVFDFNYEDLRTITSKGKPVQLFIRLIYSNMVTELTLVGMTDNEATFGGQPLPTSLGITIPLMAVTKEGVEDRSEFFDPRLLVKDFYIDDSNLILDTEKETFRVSIESFKGPQGDNGPEGPSGRGISNIYFEGTELNFEMDDGEVINAGSLPGVDIEYPFAEPVADAAGEVPTAAEFNALLTSLRNAGILST